MRRPWRWAAPVPSRSEIVTWTSIDDKQAEVLRLIASGRTVVEIGSAYGFSTACLALHARHVHAIDPHNIKPGYSMYNFDGEPPVGYEETLPAMQKLLRDLNLIHKVTIWRGYSQGMLMPYTELSRKLYDSDCRVAFIDGDHSYLGATKDFDNCAELCQTLIVDDYGEESCPEVKPALDDWLAEREQLFKRRGSLRKPKMFTEGTLAVVDL